MLHSITLTVPVLAALAGPPPTPAEPVVEQLHGVTIVDDYRWLEALEAEREDVRAWTTAQNDYTRSVLDTLPGRAALEERLAELMSIDSVSLPTVRGNRYFYRERRGDQNQAVVYLREGFDGEPRVLLDPNTLDDRGLYALDWFVPSEDGEQLAFGLSYAGDEMTVLHVMEVGSGRWLADEIPGKVVLSGWAPDNRGFLYGRLDDPANAYSRAYRYHVLGRHHRQDPLLFEQSEPSRVPGAMLGRNGRWIITEFFEGWSTQDLLVVDAARWRRTGNFDQVPIAVELGARFLPMGIDGDTLYVLTTLEASNGMLFAVDLNAPDRRRWRTVIPERDDAVLRSVDIARGMLVATFQHGPASRIERFTMEGEPLGLVQLPGMGTASIATRFDRTEAFLSYNSFDTPTTIYRLDLGTDERTVWAQPDVPVDTDAIVFRQDWCTSSDGTRVPMFIVHRRDVERTGDVPTVIYGYGGFNKAMMPRFTATDHPWLERGGVYVVANLRGGGEYGEAWHRAGMLESKQNVFDDLYAVAEHLIAEGYTTPEHLAVLGGSNGGLLTGVAAVQRPDLWAAVVSAVPLLDMLRYQHLLMARFWVPEYGDPENAEHFQWLHAYSPYHNIVDGQRYPAIFLTAGENDNRVHPMHARKMAAALQARAANDPDADPILLWVEREGGHGQGKPMHLRTRDLADRWSFLMWQTGMGEEEGAKGQRGKGAEGVKGS